MVAVLVLAVVGVLTVTVLQRLPRSQSHAAAGGCARTVDLPVLAAPAISRAVASVVSEWRHSKPMVGDACIVPTVAGKDSLATEQALTKSDRAVVWIPESSVWVTRLLADVPSLAPQVKRGDPIASSPLVIATTPGHAATLNATAGRGWAAQLTGTTPIAVPDPATTSDGAVALLGLHAALGASTRAAVTLTGISVRLAGNTLTSADAGFRNLQAHPASPTAFITSEQAVLRANRHAATPVAAAVYPAGGGLAFDFPLVTVTPATDQAFLDAAHDLGDQLRGPSGGRAVAALDLRDANGTPLDDATGPGARRAAPPTPPASAADVDAVLRVWQAARRPDSLLAVIDVSGSMKDDSGNGHSKIEVAAQSAAAAMELVPDSWSVGLWAFSSGRPPAPDWKQLAPLGPVRAQRPALVTAAGKLPGLVDGDTALYATTLAAFGYMNAHYQPNKVNSVVLMTDGGNVDPGSISLSTLLAELRRTYDADKPVSITTIALGQGADVKALEQISAATGGTTYIIRKAEDIQSVLVQSVLRRAS